MVSFSRHIYTESKINVWGKNHFSLAKNHPQKPFPKLVVDGIVSKLIWFFPYPFFPDLWPFYFHLKNRRFIMLPCWITYDRSFLRVCVWKKHSLAWLYCSPLMAILRPKLRKETHSPSLSLLSLFIICLAVGRLKHHTFGGKLQIWKL